MSQAVKDAMSHMIQQARAEKKWFLSSYQGMWFSPSELESHHKQGRFLWGPPNWVLRPPSELVDDLKRKVDFAQNELQSALRRIEESEKDVQP